MYVKHNAYQPTINPQDLHLQLFYIYCIAKPTINLNKTNAKQRARHNDSMQCMRYLFDHTVISTRFHRNGIRAWTSH